MDNSNIYEKVLLNDCFNRIKTLRNGWTDSEEKIYGLATIIDIGGNDFRQHKFIMKNCEDIIHEAIPCLIMELMKAYDIPFKPIHFHRNDAHIYSVKELEDWPEYVRQSNHRDIYAFFLTDPKYKDNLYIFKEFGIGNRLPKSLISKIINDNGLKSYCYISMVEDDAYAEVINHNNDENDPTRGTGIFSLKQLFFHLFESEEYATFKEYAKAFTNKVRDYLGFEIVRTLRPNTMFNFRAKVREDLYGFDVSEFDVDGRISESQREIISKRFFGEARYELLTGKADFAQSYMTAEWLYSSLSEVGNIDLTAIAMGYFKSIEQLLFHYLELHTYEKDSNSRSVFVGKGKDYADEKGNAKLTDELLNDEEKTKDINLGSLTGFFGFYTGEKGKYYKRNQDLLAAGIDENTYEYIVEVFTEIVGLRNGYFHKHNLGGWDKVIAARNNARLLFYLLLGAYRLDDAEMIKLGIIQRNDHDDYYKLCKYMNDRTYSIQGLDIPIFYMNGVTDKYNFWMGYQDDFIEYDNYGEPVYSGVYVRRMDEKYHIYKLTIGNNLPNEIWEGTMSYCKSAPNMIDFTGPVKKIYKDGKFLAD